MKKIITLILLVLPALAWSQEFISPSSSASNSFVRLGRDLRILSDFDLPYDENLKPFYHGVASGDPLPDRVIIWTRVTPETDGDQEVFWWVAEDLDFINIIAQGSVVTNADRDYTVKVDVEGLSSATTYYYYFSTENANSIAGRTRTAPAGDEVDQLKFAVVSCNNIQQGYFNGFANIAQRKDLDGVIHLGDYIYEYGAGPGTYGYSDERPDRANIPPFEIRQLADYRTRYSFYRLDPDLRAAHQQHPFIPIWDDHESANDSWKDGAEEHTAEDDSIVSWEERKAISKKVYFEWMPIRDNVDSTIFRTIKYGDLADIILVDTRLEGREEQIYDITAPELYSPTRTILGQEQKAWLKNELVSSTAQWKVLANQIIFSEFHVGWAANPQAGQTYESVESSVLDIWDGYPFERLELIEFIDTSNIDNTIVLTGDFHSTFAYDVAKFPSFFSLLDPLNIEDSVFYNPETGEGSVAVEFATPSITSANFDENFGQQVSDIFEFQINNPLPADSSGIPGPNPNPHMKYNDLDRHGYFVLDLQADKAQADWFLLETIETPENDTEVFASGWITEDRANHLINAQAQALPKEEQPELAGPDPVEGVVTSVVDPQNLVVFNIYPNPNFKGGYALIQYGVNKASEVTVSLTNLSGQLVAEPIRAKQQPGNYTLSYAIPTNLSSGVYLMRFEVGEDVLSRRLIVE